MSTITWTGSSNNNWNQGSNWDGGIPTSDDFVLFPTVPSNIYNITSSSIKYAAGIEFDVFSNQYDISGTSSLIIGFGASIINASSGLHKFQCPIECSEPIFTIGTGIFDIDGLIFTNQLVVGAINVTGSGQLILYDTLTATIGVLDINQGSLILNTNLPNNLNIANDAKLYLYYESESIVSQITIFGSTTLNTTSSIYMAVINIDFYSSITTDTGQILTMNGILYLDLQFSSGLTPNIYHLFVGSKIGNFTDIVILNPIYEYDGMTFSYNGSIWTSNLSSTNKYFTFNPTTGDLILIQQQYISTINISSIVDWNNYVGNTVSKDVNLLNDIVFDSNFAGNLILKNNNTFDGFDNTIYLTNINNFTGLFNLNETNMNTTIKNLTIYATNVILDDYCGYLCEGSSDGSISSNGTFDNIKLIIKNSVMGNNCGGLVGSFGRDIQITNSFVTGEIDGLNSGGFVGNNCSNVNIYNCYIIGNVNNQAGSLVGNNSTINNINDSYFVGREASQLILSGSTIVNSDNVYSAIIDDLIL
jgi:hypothetical protein